MKSYKIQLYILLIFLLLSGFWTKAQEAGKLFLQNFAPKEYKASIQNWAIAQDLRGIMYFGNNAGLLEYDGNAWNLIPTPSGVRSLAVDSTSNRIYVGTTGNFGYVGVNKSGKLEYVSLLNKVSEANKDFVDVWKIHIMNGIVYYQSFQLLLAWNPADNSVQEWVPEQSYHLSFSFGNKLYIKVIEGDLLEFDGKKFKTIHLPDALKSSFFYAMMPAQKERFVIATGESGLFWFYPHRQENQFEKFETEADEFLKSYDVFHGTSILGNQAFAIGTLEKGIFVVNEDGKLIQQIDELSHLQNLTVYQLAKDRNGALWAALDNGISRIEVSSPFSKWDEDLGLRGIVFSITRHKGVVYVATSFGVYRLHQNHFSPVQNIKGQSYDLLSITDLEGREHLLVANETGVFEIKEDIASQIVSAKHVFKLYAPATKTSSIYAGVSEGLIALKQAPDGKWLRQDHAFQIDSEVRSIAAKGNKGLWIGTNYQGVAYIDLSSDNIQTKWYTTMHGLPTLNFIQIHPYKDEEFIFATEKGIYRFDEQRERFYPDTSWGKEFADGSTGIALIAREGTGNYWLRPFDERKRWIEVYSRQNDTTFIRNAIPFRRLPEMDVFAIYPESDKGYTWIGSNEGLFRYDKKMRSPYNIPFHTLIRKVNIQQDSVIFNGNYHIENVEGSAGYNFTTQPEKDVIEMPYSEHNSVTFYFSAPIYEMRNSVQIQYFLEGNDEEWSEWTQEMRKEYTNLSAGTYTLRVRAKNIYGRIGEEASYRFVILRPWYQSYPMYAIYAILIGVVIWIAIKLYTQKLIQEKHQLEAIISERTQEVLLQKQAAEKAFEQLQKASEIISEKNQKIIDSIQYAEKIQHAMLHSITDMKKKLNDMFILFKPRDIVSGDFYWYAFKNYKIVIAAVDCTGHGVPGAFMSMVGNELLNEIVNVRGITRPDEILKELDKGIRIALHQDQNQNNDGMDIAICTIDAYPKEYENMLGIPKLEYAGAKNPLIYIKNDQLYMIKADKMPIGGSTRFVEGEVNFTRHEILLDTSTCFYIFSDGYQDQFGGGRNKKFMLKNMKEKFLEFHRQRMEEQKEVLEKMLTEWQGNEEQVDDILVIGFRITR